MSIVYDRHENVLQVPRSALVEDLGSEGVFIVEDGKAVRRAVTTGYSNNGLVEIVDGLVETDNVITVGQAGLKSDAVVTVINAPADAELPETVESTEAVAEGND